jgi:hypothetical protein
MGAGVAEQGCLLSQFSPIFNNLRHLPLFAIIHRNLLEENALIRISWLQPLVAGKSEYVQN